jgi:hypothetical protein
MMNAFQIAQLKGIIKMAEENGQFAATNESCEMYRNIFSGLVEQPTFDCSLGTIFHVQLERKIFGYDEISISVPKREFLTGLFREPIKINLF